MRHIRLRRPTAVVALLATSLMLAGGALVSTASPASALAGGGQTCTSLTATVDISATPPIATGTLSGCNSVGHNPGSLTAVVDITGAPSPGSIFWASGKATSLITLTAAVNTASTVCASGIEADTTISVGGGPFVGTSGGGVLCADLSNFPVVSLTNFGPITL